MKNRSLANLIQFCWLIWIVGPFILFFPLNQIITSARLGMEDTGGTVGTTFEALGYFSLLIVAPIFLLRLCLLLFYDKPTLIDNKGGRIALLLFLSLVILLFASLLGAYAGGVFMPILPLAVGIAIMSVCVWLARKKYKMKSERALMVGVGFFLIVALVGTQLGFNAHPRKQMVSQHVAGSGPVVIHHYPFSDWVKEYNSGKRSGSGWWVDDGSYSFGGEDYNYFLTINGLQLLILTSPLWFWVALLLRRCSRAYPAFS
jgi:hypothetical protein